ncbi:MAG: multiheme c-type cytochrome [Phycisphaerae bacterium]
MQASSYRRHSGVIAAILPAVVLSLLGLTAWGTLPTTIEDFVQPGTQPNTLFNNLQEAQVCRICHGDFEYEHAPYDRWAGSMMAQAARDPIFHACLAIANQDAAKSGDLCLRCHAPVAWLEGRSIPTNGAGLIDKDFDGVSCHFCHRLVDPIYDAVNNPVEDAVVLSELTTAIPTNPHTGQYIVDKFDLRRGPFELDPNFSLHPWAQSPYHREALLCANCHDVSNPVFVKQPDGTYIPGDLNAQHPTHNKFDEFPIERTYSEWSMSAFAAGAIEMGGRFGGNITAVSTCQDCHMPKTTGVACAPGLGGIERTDLPQHNFNGANTWVIDAVRTLYPDNDTGLDNQIADGAKARVLDMLDKASDMELGQFGSNVRVRVINQTGHKLPTGYPEGRRMWVNVKFFNSADQMIEERGAYDTATAVLTAAGTKVYEGKLGIAPPMDTIAGLPLGESFHFVLNNSWVSDNRIPPRGFTNAAFASIQAAPVNYAYADGQFWDDTMYRLPVGAARAEVKVYFQTTSKEYIEFLRDNNYTNNAGQTAYDMWLLHGKSAPALMDSASITLELPGDLDNDGDVDLTDLAILLANFGGGAGGDVDGNGVTDLSDLATLLAYFGTVL